MKSSTCFSLLFAIIARECFAEIIIKTKKLDETSILKAAIKLSKTCYSNEVKTVVLVGSSTEIISSSWSTEPQAVILIDDASKATTLEHERLSRPGTRATRYKLQNFVVTASLITRLEKTLRNLKSLRWWNHMASFLIIDESSPLNQDCSNAFNILSTAWKMNLLHAKLICHHESKGPLIYSYNPYTNQAALPWQLVKTYRKKNKHPWTLLVQSYQEGEEICKNLDFDKTNDLGGYETRLSSFSVRFDKNWSTTNLETISSLNGILLQYMFRVLNSSIKIFVESPNSISDLTNSGFADMSIDAWYLQDNFNTSMTYPHQSSGLVSMTQFRGHLSQMQKLLHVLDHSSRYGVIIVVFITFVFFKFFLRQSVTSAILNIVRLICNAAVINLTNNGAMRIYLSSLFIFSVTLQGIYQGQLASLLTKQVNLPNVDTLEDLENLNYTIYGHKQLLSYFKKSNFGGKIVPLDYFDCGKYVLQDVGAACLRDLPHSVTFANKYDLHISNDLIVKMLIAYTIREDWPVEEKLNTLISRLVEGDIFNRVYLKDLDTTMKKFKQNEKDNDKQKFEVITLKELAFAFTILGIGLACSTVIFIVEIFMQ